MIRAVLDTNILVSALLQPLGPPAKLFLLALTGTGLELCISGEIYAEYEEVIRRPRLKRTQSEIENALRAVRENGFWVKTKTRVDVCPDPDDNIFLECAEAAQADYLVTGNLRHFPRAWGVTRILTAREALEAISGPPGEFTPDRPRPT